MPNQLSVQAYIFIGLAFVLGFVIAWIIRSVFILKLKKQHKSVKGFLESEKLMKETLQKENVHVHQTKMAIELEYSRKLKEATQINKMLDEDILLLQKSNEETEALLQAGEPALHALKLKLLEAQNAIARYKATVDVKQ